MMKVLKGLKALVALVLTLTFIALVPLQTVAAAENKGKYVSEVYVAYGKDAEAAKKVLDDKGFTPIEGNLNENGDTYVMMGYKTTDNIRESITDIAVMNMDGNFNTTEYTEVLRQRKTQVAELLNEFMATIREYRANLKAGRAKATAVHDLLNKLTDDDSGMPLGDLLNSETFQDKVGVTKSITAENTEKLPDLLTILMQGNISYIQTVESLLSLAADSNDNTWVDRFAEKDYDDMLDELEDARPDLNTPSKRAQYLDSEYGTIVDNLSESVAAFRKDLLDYEERGLSVTDAKEKDIEAEFGNADTADEEKKTEIVSDELNWAETGILYEALKNYEGGKFKKGELLDFFLEEVDEDDVERYYPMAAAFTEGQRGGMGFVSFRDLLRYAFMDFDSWKSDIEKNADLSGDMTDSVYKGINREMFKTDGSIAYTGAATRAENISKGKATTTKVSDEAFLIGVLWFSTVFAGILYGVSEYGKKAALVDLVGNQAQSLIKIGKEGTKGVAPVQELMGKRFTRYSGDYYIFSKAVVLFKFATVFLAVAASCYTIYTLAQKDEVKLKPIPKYFVDNYTSEVGESFQLNYQAVECNRAEYFGADHKEQTGSSADLNADEGKQWLAIYVSKNSMAGKPVTPDFRIAETASAPSGMGGNIHTLGEKGAENLCNADYMNYSKLYSGYKTVKDKIFGESKAYVFFKLSDISKTYDESAGNMTASSIGGGMIALWGFGGMALGAVLGIAGALLIKNSRKKKEAEA